MKFVRFGRSGAEKPGLIDRRGRIRDLSGKIDDIAGYRLAPRKLNALGRTRLRDLPIVYNRTRLGPPVGNIGRIICIGLNYADHAAESGLKVPDEPVMFMKACAATGPRDPIIIPKGSKKTDWEVELGVVIGLEAQHVSKARALDHVAGYTIVNDVSEREFQIERGGQWVKGKSCDTFAPMGPYLVTPDEVGNPQRLGMWLDVNGKRFQDGSTRTMVFDVKTLVSYLSRFMTLKPGDVISTGTPPGVGLGQKPKPIYLKAGDVVSLGIEGLGTQRQVCKAFKAS